MSKYDEAQLNRHPKRNVAQNQVVKKMIKHLDLMFGEQNSGMFLAMVCTCLDKVMKSTPGDYLELRTIEIKLNDFYSVKLNCDTGEVIDATNND